MNPMRLLSVFDAKNMALPNVESSRLLPVDGGNEKASIRFQSHIFCCSIIVEEALCVCTATRYAVSFCSMMGLGSLSVRRDIGRSACIEK